jgi:hypothetical protein
MPERAIRFNSILLCADRTSEAQVALRKASVLARYLDASIELFACDADHAWALARAGEDPAARAELASCMAESRRYLSALRGSIAAADLRLSTRAACAASFAEGVADRVHEGGHDLVIKNFGDGPEPGQGTKTAADIALVQACRVPLLLTRSRPWRPEPRICAVLDRRRGDEAVRRHVSAVAQRLAEVCHGSTSVAEDDKCEAQPDLLVIAQGGPSLTESLLGTGGCDVLIVPVERGGSIAEGPTRFATLGDDPSHRQR